MTTILIENEGTEDRMDLDEFLKVNEFDEIDCAEVRRALDDDGEYSDGGGAAPWWRISVVA